MPVAAESNRIPARGWAMGASRSEKDSAQVAPEPQQVSGLPEPQQVSGLPEPRRVSRLRVL